jgi:hypothetical protein
VPFLQFCRNMQISVKVVPFLQKMAQISVPNFKRVLCYRKLAIKLIKGLRCIVFLQKT